MATPHRTSAPRSSAQPRSNVAPVGPVAPVAEWAWLMFSPILDAQRMQMETLLRWQQSIVTMQRDVREQWAVRYGGGVPIDG